MSAVPCVSPTFVATENETRSGWNVLAMLPGAAPLQVGEFATAAEAEAWILNESRPLVAGSILTLDCDVCGEEFPEGVPGSRSEDASRPLCPGCAADLRA